MEKLVETADIKLVPHTPPLRRTALRSTPIGETRLTPARFGPKLLPARLVGTPRRDRARTPNDRNGPNERRFFPAPADLPTAQPEANK